MAEKILKQRIPLIDGLLIGLALEQLREGREPIYGVAVQDMSKMDAQSILLQSFDDFDQAELWFDKLYVMIDPEAPTKR